MPSSNGGVDDGDGEEDVDVVGAKGINIVFSLLLPHKYALGHH